MTLRNRLGGDAHNLFEQVNTLLDNEDALIVLFDGRRMVSYTHGFAASPSQLELLDAEIERSIRGAVGGQSTNRRARRRREEGSAITDRGDRGGRVDRIVDEAGDKQARLAAEQAMDEVLADSFPASDPPSWNPGVIRPHPNALVVRGVLEAAGSLFGGNIR